VKPITPVGLDSITPAGLDRIIAAVGKEPADRLALAKLLGKARSMSVIAKGLRPIKTLKQIRVAAEKLARDIGDNATARETTKNIDQIDYRTTAR